MEKIKEKIKELEGKLTPLLLFVSPRLLRNIVLSLIIYFVSSLIMRLLKGGGKESNMKQLVNQNSKPVVKFHSYSDFLDMVEKGVRLFIYLLFINFF